MLKQFLFFCNLLVLTGNVLVGQNIESWIAANEKNPVEKIYIQTDAENYFTGDTVWLKVYLTDSHSGKLIPGPENVYVNLLNDSGESEIQLLLLCINGQASGRFIISENLRSGNFSLQAYTNYLFNFGPESCFYKQLTISRVTGSSLLVVNTNSKGNMVANVSFYPEGGVLLENATNLIAFKATDKTGFGVNIHGTVKDEKGLIVASFSTDYQGMGLFFLTPEAGKSYVASVDGFPSFRYNFETVKKGIKIQLVNHTSREVIVNIAGNSEDLSEESYYLVNMYRGEVLFYQAFKMDGINKVFKFESKSLKPGINKLVLLDKSLNPVSERLLFSRNFDINNLLVETNGKVFNKREEIKIRINEKKYLTEDDFSNLSVSVIHELVEPKNGFSKNISSQLLVDSELNGFVESSTDLFKDDDVSSDAKIRLLMLVNVNHYFWNTVTNKSEPLKFKQESGINLKGVAKIALTESVISDGEVTMAIQKDDEVAFMTQKTDSAGNFTFPGLLFTDSATIHVQAKSEAGNMNTMVNLEPVFKKIPPAESHIRVLKEKNSEQSKLLAMKYQIYTENKKNQPKVVKNRASDQQYNEDDGHFRIYKSADFVLVVDHFNQSYNNILDYMVGKVPGLDINGDEVRIRGSSSLRENAMPLFLLDGVPVVGSAMFNLPVEITRDTESEDGSGSVNNSQLIQTVKAIPLNDVDKIEILKSAQNTAVFGVKGANGVIAIFTRRGDTTQKISTSRGIFENKVSGYSKYSKFYSPDYTSSNMENKHADLRTLLFWKPDITTKSGLAEISFFSSDLTGKYKVLIEGVANDGTICAGTTEFEIK